MKKLITTLMKHGLTAILGSTLIGCATLQTGIETPRTSPTNCYLHLFIKESVKEKLIRRKVEFRLDSLKTVKEDVSHMVYPHTKTETSAYHVETYDKYGKIIGVYELPSGRFLIAEDFSGRKPRGKLIETRESLIDCYIPYSTNMGAVKVENHGKRNDLNIDCGKDNN